MISPRMTKADEQRRRAGNAAFEDASPFLEAMQQADVPDMT